MIDHLKEQEKGYMDLLNSLNLIEMNAASNCSDNHLLDLRESNEGLQQKQRENEIRKHQGETSHKLNHKKAASTRSSDERTASPDNSLNGSYISDTVTLNGANMTEIVKYKLKNNNTSDNNILRNSNFQDLIVVGKSLPKRTIAEKEEEDERTEDDQDLNGYEKEDDDNNEETNLRECREDILKELNEDLNTLEQLREQKRLLRSIRLRKEELKALEGRRIALEALKKLALDSEKHFDQALFDDEEENKGDVDFVDLKSESKNKIHFEKQNDLEEMSNEDGLGAFLDMLKQKQIERKNKEKQLSSSKIKENAAVEKITASSKHLKQLDSLRNLEQQIQSDMQSSDLNQPKHTNDTIKDEIFSKIRENSKAVQTGKSTTYEKALESDDETKENLSNLAHNKMKLDKLYEMQSRLAHLKQVISSFGNENSVNKEELEGKTSLLTSFKRNRSEKDQVEEDKEETKENLEENRTKLENARSKLVDLQDLIKRLQSFWIANEDNLPEHNDFAKQKDKEEREIQRLIIKDEEENEQIRKQKTKLEELKRNKEKLLEILREKESESARLNKLYALNNSDNDANQVKSKLAISQSSSPIKSPFSSSNLLKQEGIVYLNDVDIDDDEDEVEEEEKINTAQTDTLWTQMKKQLNMRESLRNKKKELEDLIRDAYNLNLNCESNYEDCDDDENRDDDENKVDVEDDDDDNDNDDCEIEEEKGLKTFQTNEEDSNEIINGYREFFLRKRQSTISTDPRHHLKQENLCSADELLESQVNSKDNKDRLMPQSGQDELVYDGEIIGFDSDMFKEKFLPPASNGYSKINSSGTQTQSDNFHLSSLTRQLSVMFESQQKLNESMQKSLDELLNRQKSQESSFHYQTQMQIQQLMFNLNSAYHEISTQRSEMNKLQDQLKNVNERLNQAIATSKQRDEKGTNTEQLQISSEASKSSSTANKISALPSYFYSNEKRGQLSNTNANFKFETYYTDDFEEDDETQQNKPPKQRKRSTSSSSSKTTTSSSTSSVTSSTQSNHKRMSTSSSVCAIKNQSDCSSSHVFRGKWNIREQNRTFELMREKIYSEVATLISQNETRPYYLLNLFKELQYLRDKNARDQVLKSIFNISNRQDAKPYKIENNLRISKNENEDESESEPNTIIFDCRARNPPQSQNLLKGHRSLSTKSSSSSLSRVHVSNTIRNEVNGLISKIIKSIKYSDEDNDLLYVRFNRFYLNDMIDKVLNVLEQSNQYGNYLQKYEKQLCSYLKDALKKYENRPLVSYIEDILIDISDILNNELTFYSIISSSRLRSSRSSFATYTSSANDAISNGSIQRFEQVKREFERSASHDSSSSSHSEKIFYFDDLSDSNAEETVDLLKRFKLIFTENKNIQDNLNTPKENELEPKASTSFKKEETRENESYSYSTDEEESAESDELQQTILNKHEFERELFDKMKKQNDTKSEPKIQAEQEDKTENTASLRGNTDLSVDETKSTAYSLLDNIIMNAIPDVLVGDPNSIGVCLESQLMQMENKNFSNQFIDEQDQETGSQKSESSTSDNYVIVKESQIGEEFNMAESLTTSELSKNTINQTDLKPEES